MANRAELRQIPRRLRRYIAARTFKQFAVSTPRRRRQAEWRIDADAVKLDFDPDAMAEWCRIYFGKVDATARKFYAAFLLRSGGATLDRP